MLPFNLEVIKRINMQKLLSYFIALFVLFFACTQSPPVEKQSDISTLTTNATTIKKEEIPTPTPIPPPSVPPGAFDKVKQAPAKDLVYPKEFKNMGIKMYSGAKMENNVVIDNNAGKFGRQTRMTCAANFEEVYDFYTNSLPKNGWEKNAKMDKSHQDEDVKYFSTNYMKDNYTLMVAITEMGAGSNVVSVSQVLKGN